MNSNDTLIVTGTDSLIAETGTGKSDVDTVIYSTASDSLIFYVKKKKMDIFGDGKIEYKNMQITSANIFVDFEKNQIHATGELSDSAEGKLINTPVLTEGTESYDGKERSIPGIKLKRWTRKHTLLKTGFTQLVMLQNHTIIFIHLK